MEDQGENHVRPARLRALDVLRGLAVAGMIVVTSPGDWNKAYWPLKHADWNGWTPTDIVFPTFLFSVGVAIGLSFPKPLGAPSARADLWRRVLRRVASLLALGLVLNWLYTAAVHFGLPSPHPYAWTEFRIPGVPQRIGLCYLFAVGLIVATTARSAGSVAAINSRALWIAAALILIGYWALLQFVPVPGFGVGQLDPGGSLPAWLDRRVFTPAYMWPLGSITWGGPVTYDPEGLLSTLPALVNVLFGALAARELRVAPERALPRIAIAGALLVAAGLLLDPVFPINKRLWTSSFALLSSGVSTLALVCCVIGLRSERVSPMAVPFKILGGNAILAFTISILLGYASGFPIMRWAEEPASPQYWGDQVALSIISDEYLASLACALSVLAFITLLIWPLHRRAIHLRL
jgi:predicted acyltransferase